MKIKTVLKIPFKVGDNAYFETYENNATICLGVQGHKIIAIEVNAVVKGQFTDIKLPLVSLGKHWALSEDEMNKALQEKNQ